MTEREQQQREQQLRAAYARAVGLKQSAPTSGNVAALCNDLNAIVALVRPFIGDEMAQQLSLRGPDIWQSSGRDGPTYWCYAAVLHGKLGQLISYLEHVYFIDSHIVEIGRSFRNPTHHHILDKYTREDALKLCAFIDNILLLVDKAVVAERGGSKSRVSAHQSRVTVATAPAASSERSQ
jgi:hypothetical protein